MLFDDVLGVKMGKKRKKRSSGLTEKALFEGALIRNQNKYAIVLRKSDGELHTVVKNVEANPDNVIKKILFVRGIFVLVQNIILLLESLEYSAEFFGNDTSEETFLDKLLNKLFGKHTNMIVSAAAAVVSFIFCCALLTLVPLFLSQFLQRYIVNTSVIHIIEFAAYVIVLLLFFASAFLYKDIRRVLKYHAAAHQCINCIERGRKLNYKNVSSSSIFFGRCTTGYIIFCIFVSAVLFALVRIDSIPLRLLFRLIYIPLATGLFYEFYVCISNLPFNFLYKIFTVPSIIFESIGLIKPDDEMITTAMSALDAVFDWREFLVNNFPDKYTANDLRVKFIKKDEKQDFTEYEDYEKIEKETEESFARIDEELFDESYVNELVSKEKYGKEDIDLQNQYSEYEGSDEFAYFTEEVSEEELYEGYEDANFGFGSEQYDENGEEIDESFEEEYEGYESEAVYENLYEENDAEAGYENKYEEYNEEPGYETDETGHIEDKDEIEYVSDAKEEKEEDNEADIKEINKGEDKLSKTQPIGIDFDDDYGFDPDDEEVPENEMLFEPVDEKSLTGTIDLPNEEEYEEYEEGNVPLFSKDIESIPMPERLDNLVEFLPEGGVMSRIYNLNTEENDNLSDDEEEYDFDNIIDENGHLTLKDTDAFNRKLDEEYDEIFKRLGLDPDDD